VRDRKPRNLLQAANGAYGNAATRIEREMTSGGFSYGSYPEIDDLFHQQARETDRKKREALLHQIQKMAYDRVMFAPIWEFAQLHGVGAGGGAGARAHRAPSLLVTLRGSAAEEVRKVVAVLTAVFLAGSLWSGATAQDGPPLRTTLAGGDTGQMVFWSHTSTGPREFIYKTVDLEKQKSRVWAICICLKGEPPLIR